MKRIRLQGLLAVGVLVAVIAAIAFIGLRNPVVEDVATYAGRDAGGAAVPGTVAAALQAPYTGPAFVTGLENLPASLRGTEVDGELQVDAAGNLVMAVGVRNLFDYFLSTLGEEPLPTVVARIRAYLRSNLPATAAAQGEKALEDYLAYREAMSQLPASGAVAVDKVDTAALRAQHEQARALRTRYLDPAQAAAFYGEEDAYDDYALARVDVLRDPALTPTEKAARTTALVDALPPSLQESVRAVSLYANLDQLTTDWQRRGGSVAELRSIREAAVGPAAADRLEALDGEQAAWTRRVDSYLQARDAIIAAPGLADADREQQIAGLRTRQGFTREEQLRLVAYEKMHDGGT